MCLYDQTTATWVLMILIVCHIFSKIFSWGLSGMWEWKGKRENGMETIHHEFHVQEGLDSLITCYFISKYSPINIQFQFIFFNFIFLIFSANLYQVNIWWKCFILENPFPEARSMHRYTIRAGSCYLTCPDQELSVDPSSLTVKLFYYFYWFFINISYT